MSLAKEKTYQLGLLDGNDGLGGLNARYDMLNDGIVAQISYQTKALNDAKKAAERMHAMLMIQMHQALT